MTTTSTAAAIRIALGQGARTAKEIRSHARTNGTPIEPADYDAGLAELVAAGIAEVTARGNVVPLVDANGVPFSRLIRRK